MPSLPCPAHDLPEEGGPGSARTLGGSASLPGSCCQDTKPTSILSLGRLANTSTYLRSTDLQFDVRPHPFAFWLPSWSPSIAPPHDPEAQYIWTLGIRSQQPFLIPMPLAARHPACRLIELTPPSPPALLYTQRISHPGLGQAPLSLPVCLLQDSSAQDKCMYEQIKLPKAPSR